MKLSLDKILYWFIGSAAIGVGLSYNKVYLFHLLLLLLVVKVFLDKKLILKNLVSKSIIDLIPTAIFIWYAISCLWAFSFLYSIRYLFYLICGLSIIYSINYFAKNTSKLLEVFKLLKVIFLIEIIISILEGITVFRWPISPFSKQIYFFGRSMATENIVNEKTLSYLFSMPTGFQWNPNNLAILMVQLLPFFLFLKKWKHKTLGITAILSVVVMAGSRGAFLALVLIVFVYITFYLKNWKLLFSCIAGTVLLFFLLNNVTNNIKVNEITSSFNTLKMYLTPDFSSLSKASIGIRQSLIIESFNPLIESKFMGIGGGGSVAYFESIGGVYGKYTSLHNFWMELLVEGGILVFLGFIYWYFSIYRKLYLIYKNNENYIHSYYAGALSLSLVGFTIAAVSASSVIYFFPMWIMFGLSTALIKLN